MDTDAHGFLLSAFQISAFSFFISGAQSLSIMAKGNSQKLSNGSDLDFEAQLWAAADKMRGHTDAAA